MHPLPVIGILVEVIVDYKITIISYLMKKADIGPARADRS